MSRIPSKEYDYLMGTKLSEVQARNGDFQRKIGVLPRMSHSLGAADNAKRHVKIVREMKKHEFGVHDTMWDYCREADKPFLKSKNDTHGMNRKWEKWHGGAGDGKPEADFNCANGEDLELKLIQVTKAHELEQVMTIGTLCPKEGGEKYRPITWDFEESCTYKKIENMVVTTYFQKGKQLGDKICNSFHFSIHDKDWYERMKEDWEHYREEWNVAVEEYKRGERKKKASGIMKSDTSGKRCPNRTLGIRSDGIIFNKQFFKEVSEYYGE